MPSLLDPTDELVTPEERKQILQQNLFGGLLQGGLQLLAAGDNLYPWQRAQMLGQVGQTIGAMPGNIREGMQNAAQQKLLQQKYADKKREGEILGSDDFKAAIAQMPPEMQALARVNPQAAISAVSIWRQMQMQDQREKAAAERQRQREDALAAREPPKITHDEFGRPIGWDPVSRTWAPIQSGASGDMRSAYGLPGGAPQQQSGNQPAPQQMPAGAAPDAAVPPSVNLKDSVDYNKAFGLPGVSRYYSGKLQGLVEGQMTGGNVEAANARANYNNVRNDIISVLTKDMPGRQSKYTTKMVADTVPEAGTLWTSKSDAVSGLDSAKREIEAQIGDLEAAFNAPGNIKMRADIAGRLKDLYRVHANIGAINQQLVGGNNGGGQQQQVTTPANITPQQALEELKRRGVR